MKKRLFPTFLLFFLTSGIYSQDLRSDSIDIRSCLLKVNLTDFATKILQGEATLGCKSRVNGIHRISLDLLKLTVDSVRVDGYNVPYTYNDSILDIDLLNTFNPGDSFTVRISYHDHPLQLSGDFGGFYWTNAYAFNIGVSFLADPHNYGRVWFPCFDNFRERSLYEFYITTKNTHKAFCNGLLQGVTATGNTKTWHWKLEEQIPSYLASVAVSDYETLTDTVQGIGGVKQIELAARSTDTASLKNLFVHLPDAFHILEDLWGEYKWDRVGYCIVPFNAGAMEHATNISFMQYYLNLYSSDCENTMVHELSHHWFGDLATCDSASEMWLNEGWAVYNEMLFHEKFFGEEDYKTEVRKNHEKVLHDTHISDGGYLPVSGVPSEQTYGSTVYDKGSDVIHTLRWYMGDSAFFRCMKSFLRDYSFKNVSTTILRDYLINCSGINLNDYFNDWVYNEGFPHFSFTTTTFESVPLEPYEFAINIRQHLNHAPHYYEHVPITITYFDSLWHRTDRTVFIDGECTQVVLYQLYNPAPTFIALDFDEQLQDAITDEWKIISDTGTYDFGTARMIVQVNAASDSSLVRIEHNWIRPEPMKTKIPSLHLHDKRYWTVDGIFNSGFSADARLDYNGADSLDAAFINNSEDSLAVMWRANADSEWAFADSFSINKQNNANDARGYATIYNLRKGQYCLAIWNSDVSDTTTAETVCVFTSVADISGPSAFHVFPNPAHQTVMVTFERNIFQNAEILDLQGRTLQEIKISAEQNSITFKVGSMSSQTLLVRLTRNDGRSFTQKIIKQ